MRTLARGVALAFVGLPLFTGSVIAGTPAATVISNAASATYGDSSGASYSITSNIVTVTVQTVIAASITGTSTPSATAAPNQILDDTYVLANTGNAPGTFSIAPSVASAGSASPSIVSIRLIAAGGTTMLCQQGGGFSGCLSTFLTANPVAPGSTLTVDIFYNDGNFVQPAGSTTSTTSTLAGTMTTVGNGGATITPAPASLSTTIVADALLDVQTTVAPLTSTTQPIVYTITAANRGALATVPLSLLIGTGLPVNGIAISDLLPANLKTGRWAALPSITAVSADYSASPTVDLYYTTAAAPFSPITAWTKIPKATGGPSDASNLAVLNAASVSAIVGVISGATMNGTLQAVHGGPSSQGQVNNPAVTITLAFAQRAGEAAVGNFANSAAGNNAMAPGVVGPSVALPPAVSTAAISADLTSPSGSQPGSGFSQTVTYTAVLPSVHLGPAGAPDAQGAFSFAAGVTGLWDSGSADVGHDYTAAAILSGSAVVTDAAGVGTIATSSAPGVIAIAQAIKNVGNLVDSYTLGVNGFANTPIGAGGWTVTFAPTPAACAGGPFLSQVGPVAPTATANFYSCWTPVANGSLITNTAYGGAVVATSVAGGAAVNDTTYDVLFPGGFVTLVKTSSVSGTATSGAACSAAAALAGCTVNYAVTYSVVLPKNSNGGANTTPAGAIGFSIQENGVAGINASPGGVNSWATFATLGSAPVSSGGPPSAPTVTYFDAAHAFAATGAGVAQGALASTAVPPGCTGFRLDFGTVPYGANNAGTVTFFVKIN